MFNGVTVGCNATIIRFMKGVYNLRLTEVRYCKTWDVSKVLVFLRKLTPVRFLSLKDLTLEMIMLIALSSACRTQSLQLLGIDNMVKGAKCFTLFYSGLLKQSRPGYNEAFLELFSYPPDMRLCVIFVLNDYLSRTGKLRGNCKKLFISYVKPFGPVSRGTISRWLKTVMSSLGIDLKSYSSHSIRSAVVSKAYQHAIPVEKIMQRAGWTNARTFAKNYKKPIEMENQRFHNAIFKM